MDCAVLDLQDQHFSYCVALWHHSLVVHVGLQLQIDEKWRIGHAINSVLAYYIVGSVGKVLACYGLDLENQVVGRNIFKGNWWYAHVLLGWDFYNMSVFTLLVEIFQTDNFGHLAFCIDL